MRFSSSPSPLPLLCMFLALLLLLDVVLCKSSSSSSSSESDDEDASKPAKLLSKEGLKQRLQRALRRIAKIHERNKGHWKAKLIERFAMMSDAEKKSLGGAILLHRNGTAREASPPEQRHSKLKDFFNLITKRRHSRATTAPTCTYKTIFDARQQWPACAPIINKVQDQSRCGNCWAVSTASTFSDRYCINRVKKGQSIDANAISNHFSALELTSCCKSKNTRGCDGGAVLIAWQFIRTNGIVTGTDYTTKDGCKPYPFAPTLRGSATTPACQGQCTNAAWKTAYNADRKFVSVFGQISKEGNTVIKAQSNSRGQLEYSDEPGSSVFDGKGSANAVDLIEKEIKANGPVVAGLNIYEDLYFYSSGVYKHSTNKMVGGHALRLIGWGKQTCSDGTSQDYWIAINSWNTDWGQDGIVYIAKGVEESGIESMGINWGTPNV